jgi:hypothetical protein
VTPNDLSKDDDYLLAINLGFYLKEPVNSGKFSKFGDFDHILSSLAPPDMAVQQLLRPVLRSPEATLQSCISSFSPRRRFRGQNSRFKQKLRFLVLQVPKISKKKCPKHIDINSQNEAHVLLFQNMGQTPTKISPNKSSFIRFLT